MRYFARKKILHKREVWKLVGGVKKAMVKVISSREVSFQFLVWFKSFPNRHMFVAMLLQAGYTEVTVYEMK